MTALEDRRIIVRHIDEAHAAGARLAPARQVVGITARTLQRWRTEDGQVLPDGRPTSSRPRPAHALTEEEKALMLATANEPRFASLPPARIVPMLADEGIYIASESSFQRVLRAAGQNRRRGRARTPVRLRPPTTHVAPAPGQVWCWDMTYLPSKVRGQWFHLYLIMDLYSRKIVGWEIHADDSADHAARLLNRVALSERIHAKRDAEPAPLRTGHGHSAGPTSPVPDGTQPDAITLVGPYPQLATRHDGHAQSGA